MSQEEKQYFVPIPASTDPNSIGNLVQEALQKNYSVTISEGTARSISMMAAESIEKNKENIGGVEFRLGTDGFGWIFRSSNEEYKNKSNRVKRIIAREGLLLIGVFIGAFSIAQNQFVQDWVVSLGIATPQLPAQVLRERYGMSELGEIILKRAAVISFLSIIALYGFIRFIFWSIRTLKNK